MVPLTMGAMDLFTAWRDVSAEQNVPTKRLSKHTWPKSIIHVLLYPEGSVWYLRDGMLIGPKASCAFMQIYVRTILAGETEGFYRQEQWLRNGLLHREDGPSVVWKHWGVVEYGWHRAGQRHRLEGPALIVVGVEDLFFVAGKRYHSDKSYGRAVKAYLSKQRKQGLE